MTPETLKEAIQIALKIETYETNILKINRLLNSCGLSATISGTPPHQFTKTEDYTAFNKELIKKMLEEDKLKYQQLIDKLNLDLEKL